jgi:hypothetical protein
MCVLVLFSLVACGNTSRSTKGSSEENLQSISSEDNIDGDFLDGEEEEDAEEMAMIKEAQKVIHENSKELPDEISNIATVDGDLSKDIVLVNTQGGPMYELDIISVKMMLAESIGNNDVIVVNVHQQQTLNPLAFKDEMLTLEEAKLVDEKSVADLAKVVTYFKNEGKTVYVLGVSFGAWMVQDLITNYGEDIADKYFIANGRVDMPESIWKAFSQGGSGYFESGVKEMANPNGTMEDPEGSFDNVSNENKNISILAAGLGHKRYSKLLAHTDLSKVFYLYGQRDVQVGRLLDEEVNFLKGQGATVVTYEGGHSAPNDKMKEGFKFLGIVGK